MDIWVIVVPPVLPSLPCVQNHTLIPSSKIIRLIHLEIPGPLFKIYHWSLIDHSAIIPPTEHHAFPATAAQSIFINRIPEYSDLPSCAEYPLSTIVRDMVSGCGDGGRTTSYRCFCTDRSSHMASVISSNVASDCLPETPSAVSEALAVFNSYCALKSDSMTSNATQVLTPPSTVATTTGTSSGIVSSTVSHSGVSSRTILPTLPTQTTSGSEKSQGLMLRLLGLGLVVAGLLPIVS
ncbi:hypothetical protein BX600DRAFT_525380 [Xylariales sp. PMI_506]|nr:hypothetical protein BX600DRAFT_525380 [Xylariales sp. PMI_506]